MDMIPKFVNEGASIPSKAIGSTLADFWNLIIGSHVSLWSEKQKIRQKINLMKYKEKIEEKTLSIPEEHLVDPQLHILGPALEASKYYIDSSELRDMFASLVASSIDDRKTKHTHPSFVEIIKQLSSDEAKILKSIDPNTSYPMIRVRGYDKDSNHFAEPLINFSVIPYEAGCEFPELGPSYLENIVRLGIAEVSYDVYTTKENSYKPLKQHEQVVKATELLSKTNKRVEIKKGAFTPNSYGRNFYISCII